MPRLSLKTIAEVTCGKVVGDVPDPANVFATGYAFDSRRLEPGDLFLALRGESRDGHLFVKHATQRGAVGAMVERQVKDVPPELPQVVVSSTLEGLQKLAADVRRRLGIPVMAVSGSNGKTTTKEMLAAILSRRMKTHKSPGNFNNHIGVPLSILGLQEAHEVLVLELGSNHRGEIAKLSDIARPTIGILTNVGTAHIGHFDSVDEIALEKTDLLRHLDEGGRAVVNGDDANLAAALRDVDVEMTRFGMGRGTEWRATGLETHGAEGTTFSVAGVTVSLKVPGVHNVYNALAAMATAGLLGVERGEAAQALGDFLPFRTRAFTLGEITIIDDTYNANPDSVRAVLALLAGHAAERRVFVLGEMLELGRESARLHRETGRAIAGSGVDVLIGIGGDTREVVAGACDEGMSKDRAHFFETKPEGAAFLMQILVPGDVVLIKGSRATALEEVCDYLRRQLVEGRT